MTLENFRTAGCERLNNCMKVSLDHTYSVHYVKKKTFDVLVFKIAFFNFPLIYMYIYI